MTGTTFKRSVLATHSPLAATRMSPTSSSSDALQDLKRALQEPIEDVESFAFLLSSALTSLDIHPTSVSTTPLSTTLKSISRNLPAVQLSLLTNSLPTFLPALDDRQRALLRSFFAPPKRSETLAACRTIALTTYLTLPALLAQKPLTPLPRESREYILETLSDLLQYGIDDIYWAVWSVRGAERSQEVSARELKWEEAVNSMIGLPSKVANAVGRWKSEGWTGDVPQRLVPKCVHLWVRDARAHCRPYFDRLSAGTESLMYELSNSPEFAEAGSRLGPVFRRLSSLGLFSPTQSDRSPSFWPAALPSLLSHIHPPTESPLPPYPSAYLPNIFLSLPSSTFNPLAKSLIHYLTSRLPYTSHDSFSTEIDRAASVLESIIGTAKSGGEALEAALDAVLAARATLSDQATHTLLRTVVVWVSFAGEKSVIFFLDSLMSAWTDPKHIRYALYAQQFALTYTLLLALSLLSTYHAHLVDLSCRPRFLSAMQAYLAHPDSSIRRLGLLVAEVVSELTIEETGMDTDYNEEEEISELKAGLEGEEVKSRPKPRGGKRLGFGSEMWDGEGDGRDEARWLRNCVGGRAKDVIVTEDESDWMLGWDQPEPIPDLTPQVELPRPRGRTSRPSNAKAGTKAKSSRPKIVMLDEEQEEDMLEGYDAQSPSSSRSPSPTPSYLDEVAADPTLALDSTQKKKITRPVYISQLLVLLKDREKPECIEMALRYGESLIRAKRSFGGELEEHATALAAMIVALNDPFHLEDFDEKRQGMLNALTACAPRVTAPYLAEIYFVGHYSLHQRSVILTALSMGARELAGLSVPQAKTTRKIDFPSKTLPPALHRRYITERDIPGQLEEAVDGVRGLLLSKGAQQGVESVPELAREKNLRVGSTRRNLVAETGSLAERQMAAVQGKSQGPVVPYKDVAAEYFIMPLINRFWQYFQDSTTRESRAVARGDRYRGAGTGMILSPMALEKFLMTLTLLLHAARHSPSYLAVLAPETLELAVTLASRHLISPDDFGGPSEDEGKQGRESSVVGSALEMALVVLDASFELDGGRTLAMTKPELLMAVGEWANGVFNQQEKKGERLAGEGGMREGRVRAAAAGVVVKVADIGDKWGRTGVI